MRTQERDKRSFGSITHCQFIQLSSSQLFGRGSASAVFIKTNLLFPAFHWSWMSDQNMTDTMSSIARDEGATIHSPLHSQQLSSNECFGWTGMVCVTCRISLCYWFFPLPTGFVASSFSPVLFRGNTITVDVFRIPFMRGHNVGARFFFSDTLPPQNRI